MVRQIIRKAVLKNRLLFKIYYQYIFKPRDLLEKFLDERSRARKGNFFFVQVGANDGIWNDPLYKFIRRDRWKGILIEPQKNVFSKLINNYRKSKGLIFENVAIDSIKGSRNLYKISFSESQWATGLSSFNREDVQRMIDAGYAERMAAQEKVVPPSDKSEWISMETVVVETFSDVMARHNVRDIDLVMIDAEGYDYEIIKTIPFKDLSIRAVVWEHSHHTAELKRESREYLSLLGYRILECESDTIAYKDI